jgi:hypothetical protein
MFDGTGFVANRKPQFHLCARTVPEAAGRRIHLTLDPRGHWSVPHGQGTKCATWMGDEAC